MWRSGRIVSTHLSLAAELQGLAREVQDLVESRVGATAFSAAHVRVRQAANERRHARKQQRAIEVRRSLRLSRVRLIHTVQVVADPELAGLRKTRRNAVRDLDAALISLADVSQAKKDLQKRKSASFAARRHRTSEAGIKRRTSA